MYTYNINRRKFLGLIGCCTCGLIIPSCTTAPITQRRQLKILPESYINRQAFQMYQRVKNSKDIKISNDKKTLSEIREIGKNIEESVSTYFDSIDKPDPTFNFQWEYILIDNIGTTAADIFSGGAISRTSRATGVDVAGMLRTFGIDNPFGRKQETEADYLGLIFSSLAGYDIRESVKIWERMKEAYKGQEIPEWMSTHPSNTKRIQSLKNWIPEVILEYPPIKKL